MRYKLINSKTGEEHLCDKVTIDSYDYYVSDKIIKDVRPYYSKWQVEEGTILNKFPTYLTDLSSCRLVIATNNSNIDDVPKVVDEVERLANEFGYHDQKSDTLFREGLILGYNKSQETHPFSKEDMIDFADWVYRSQFDVEGYTQDKETKKLFQLWEKQRIKTLYYE